MKIKEKDNKNYLILMADVIDSRKMEGQVMVNQLGKLVKNISEINKDLFLSPLTITLGDEFQSVIKHLRNGLDIIVQMEEKIIELNLSIKLRYVIVWGEIDTEINTENAHEMYGSGFINARSILQEMKKTDERIRFDTGDHYSEKLNNLFYLYSSQIDKWKPDDFNIINAFLANTDYYQVARVLEKNRGSMWKKKKSLRIKQYHAIKYLIRNAIDS